MTPFGLVSPPHPAALPEIAIKLFWHARCHRDPANRWLHRQVVELFADSEASSADAADH